MVYIIFWMILMSRDKKKGTKKAAPTHLFSISGCGFTTLIYVVPNSIIILYLIDI
jgi:hypothetical protein